METFQPYLTYLGIGVGVIVGLLLLVWLTATFWFMWRTKGLNRFIITFFKTLKQTNLKDAYALTTPNFRAETELKDFRKFVKQNKLDQHKKISMTVPELAGGNGYRFNLLVKLTGDRELPMTAVVIKDQAEWRLEALDV